MLQYRIAPILFALTINKKYSDSTEAKKTLLWHIPIILGTSIIISSSRLTKYLISLVKLTQEDLPGSKSRG